MAHFDRGYLREAEGRLLRLLPHSRPRWGELSGERVIQHLHGALRYSLGELPEVEPMGSFLYRRLLGPLTINGWLPVPRHAKFRRSDGTEIPIPMFPGGVPELVAAGEAFLVRQESEAWRPPIHPAFGALGPRGWSKLHYRHFEHHLGQFGV